jgi:hypothetical protein
VPLKSDLDVQQTRLCSASSKTVLQKVFSSKKNPEITPCGHRNGSCPLHHHQITNQKALRQAVQLPLNHHTPNLHTVAPGLCTVVFPQWPRPLIITNCGQSYSLLIRLSSFQTSAWNPLKPKKKKKNIGKVNTWVRCRTVMTSLGGRPTKLKPKSSFFCCFSKKTF